MPRPRRFGGAADVDVATLVAHLAPVEGVDARYALDEGRLARAVVAHQRHHLAGADLEIDAVESLNGPERLGHAPAFEDGCFSHDPAFVGTEVGAPPRGAPTLEMVVSR